MDALTQTTAYHRTARLRLPALTVTLFYLRAAAQRLAMRLWTQLN